MKKTIIPLLVFSILTASFPAQGMSGSYTWAKNNIYTLVGVGIAAIATFFVYTKYQNQEITEYSAFPNYIRDESSIRTKNSPGDIRILQTDAAKIFVLSDITGPRRIVQKACKVNYENLDAFVTANKLTLKQTYHVPKSVTRYRQPIAKSLALKHTHPEGKIYIEHGNTFDIDLTIETPGREACITQLENAILQEDRNQATSKKEIRAHIPVTFL